MKHVERVLDGLPSSKRAVRFAIAVLAVVAFALIGLLFWQVHRNSAGLDQAAAVARARGQALGTANAKLTQNGIAPVQPTKPKTTRGETGLGPTTPSSTPKLERGLQGERGIPGVAGATGTAGSGPTKAQVAQAVTDYCTGGKCASGPTRAQVAAAVVTYCDQRGDCTGPAGATGASGSPGRSGAAGEDATGKPGASGSPGVSGAAGAPGRAPTTDEISAAVAAYCSDGGCKGSKGDTGPAGSKGDAGASGQPGRDGSDGKAGADAPHFTKIECGDDNTWAFTLSDGTVLHADGPCRAATVTVTVPPTDPPTSPDPTSTAP